MQLTLRPRQKCECDLTHRQVDLLYRALVRSASSRPEPTDTETPCAVRARYRIARQPIPKTSRVSSELCHFGQCGQGCAQRRLAGKV
jgi:hypothetical protein